MKKYIVLWLVVVVFILAGCESGQTEIGGAEQKTSESIGKADKNSEANEDNKSDNDIIMYENYYYPQDDDYWYETNNDDHKIYAVSKRDNSRKCLYKTENENYLISASDVSDEKIYFRILEMESKESEQIYSPFKICSMNKDGTDFTVLLTRESLPIYTDSVVREIHAYNDLLFLYTNDRQLFMYDIVKSEAKKVDDMVIMFQIHNEKLYYISNWSLCVTDIGLEEKQILLQATTDWNKEKGKNLISGFVFVGDELFYCQRAPYGIYQYCNGENKFINEISIDEESTVFAHEQMLYFIRKEADTYKLISYDPINEKLSEVLSFDDFNSTPRIINGYFYYMNSDDNIIKKKIDN